MADFVKLNGYDVKDAVSRASITSIQSTLNGIKRPEDFGCIGNGIVDDTENFQTALTGGGYILGTPGKNYRITESLTVNADTVLDLNHATITADNLSHTFYNFTRDDTEVLVYNGRGNITIKNGTIVGGAISFIHGHNILIEDIHFLNVNNDHVVEICACNGYTIRGCIFEGLSNAYPSFREMVNIDPCVYGSFPWLPEGSNTFDGTKNNDITITDNIFKPSANTNYAYMQRAIGCHAYTGVRHSNIMIHGNTILGNSDTDYSFMLSDLSNVMVSDNQMSSKWGLMINGCDYVMVSGNKSYCNDSTNRVLCVPGGDGVSTHISIVGNALINRGGKVIGAFTEGGFSFDQLQPSNEWSGGDSTVNVEVPLTSVNTVILQIGSVGGAQLSTITVSSFHNRGFQVGESYPLIMRYGLAIMTIASATQITISTSVTDGYTNCRHLIIEKATEFIPA